MSTIAVVRKGGLAAIAADTLTKWGSGKETADYLANADKIFRVGGSYLAAAGPTTGFQALRHYFARRKAKPTLRNADRIYAEWLRLHAALRRDYFVLPEEDEKDAFESSRLDVLIANPYGIFGVEAYRSVQVFTKFYAYGSGCDYALGAMYAAYGDPRRSAADVAKLGVMAAAEFHDATAPPVLCHTVRLK